MEPIRFLHTSDIHIDWLFNRFAPQAKMTRRREVLATLDTLAGLAIKRQCHALVMAGDLFHRPLADRHVVASVGETFRRLDEEGVKVLLLPGNHDPLSSGSLYEGVDFPGNVYIFRSREWEEYEDIPGLTVHALPFWEERACERVLENLRRPAKPGYHIAILHGTYRMLSNFPEQYYPFTAEDIAASGMDYIALGHYHNFLDCSNGGVPCFYPGAPHPLSFNNISPRVALEVTLEQDRARVEPLALTSRPYRQYTLDVTGLSLHDIYRHFSGWADPETCARVVLTGVMEEVGGLDPEMLSEAWGTKFFHLEMEDSTSYMPETGDNTVQGIFARRMREELARENLTAREREVLTQALRYGMAALEGRKL